jgi:hypothetical protein
LYFYKTADQFVFSCLKQKHFNKKKHQQYLHLTFLLAFPKCKKKRFLLFDLKRKKKNTESQKQRFWAKGEKKKATLQKKAFLLGHAGKKKKFFFSHVFILFFSLRYLF